MLQRFLMRKNFNPNVRTEENRWQRSRWTCSTAECTWTNGIGLIAYMRCKFALFSPLSKWNEITESKSKTFRIEIVQQMTRLSSNNMHRTLKVTWYERLQINCIQDFYPSHYSIDNIVLNEYNRFFIVHKAFRSSNNRLRLENWHALLSGNSADTIRTHIPIHIYFTIK